MSHFFEIWTVSQTKCWKINVDFLQTVQENGAGRGGRPGGQPKFCNLTFFIKGTPLKSGTVGFLFYATFRSASEKPPLKVSKISI